AAQRYGIDWKKKMMFQLLASKWKMSTSAWFGKWARNMFGGPWIESKLNAGALNVERIPPFNDKPFAATVPEVVKPEGKAKARVLYFHGCATNYLYGAIGQAVVDVLKKMGVEVIIPKGQSCCGLPIFMSGERETSLRCIRDTLKLFAREDVDAVVVDCATCGAALKNEYAHLLSDLRQLGEEVSDGEIAAAELLASKLKDVTVFIDEHKEWLPKMKANGHKLRVTYHDPCHLVKGQKISAQPRRTGDRRGHRWDNWLRTIRKEGRWRRMPPSHPRITPDCLRKDGGRAVLSPAALPLPAGPLCRPGNGRCTNRT
ncbi:MAG: heterodisulfide reductase-related iron-sulfur binding cluster, partial [Thermodesulfobacteriota bacterium]